MTTTTATSMSPRNYTEEQNTTKVQDFIEFIMPNSTAPKQRLLSLHVDDDAWDVNIFKKILEEIFGLYNNW